MGDEEVGEIRFLTIDGNLTTTTAPIVRIRYRAYFTSQDVQGP